MVLRSGLALAADAAWASGWPSARRARGGDDPRPDAVRLESVTDLPPEDWYEGLALLNRG